MPPKVSKKTADKAKAKMVEDKTFGLKNKNRSSKVQAYVQTVQKAAAHSGNPDQKKRDKENAERREKKNDKKAFEAEMAKLFNAVSDAPKKAEPGEGEEGEGEAYDPDNYLWQADDFDEVEADDERLEDKLEKELEEVRQRTDLTPVTEESFQAWKAQKRQEAADAEKNRKAKAKKDNKVRGWDLWEDNKDLFVDDDDAEDEYEREESEEYDLDDDAPAATHVDPTAK